MLFWLLTLHITGPRSPRSLTTSDTSHPLLNLSRRRIPTTASTCVAYRRRANIQTLWLLQPLLDHQCRRNLAVPSREQQRRLSLRARAAVMSLVVAVQIRQRPYRPVKRASTTSISRMIHPGSMSALYLLLACKLCSTP